VQEKTQANPTQNSRICICICASLSVRIYFGFTACNYPGKEEPENTENTECVSYSLAGFFLLASYHYFPVCTVRFLIALPPFNLRI